jgi:hypothetical protein
MTDEERQALADKLEREITPSPSSEAKSLTVPMADERAAAVVAALVVRVGRRLGLWTVEQWNPRASCWDVMFTFETEKVARAYLAQHFDGTEETP